MKISIICVGKIKEKYFRDAVAEYEKRLSKYCKLEIIEVADEKTPDHASELVEEQIKAKEAERILRHIKEDAYVYSLEILGEKPDSVGFAGQIERLGIQGKSHIQPAENLFSTVHRDVKGFTFFHSISPASFSDGCYG